MPAGDLACFDPWKGVNDQTAHIQDMWDYQWCTEQFMPNSRDGVHDMFWSSPWNETAAFETCEKVGPRHFCPVSYNPGDIVLSDISNVIGINLGYLCLMVPSCKTLP